MSEPIRVLVCDDHELFREGLLGVLNTEPDIDVVASAENAEEAAEKAIDTLPDVVLMDIRMDMAANERSGLAATARIRELVPSAQVIMLTASDEREDLLDAIKAGAAGYLLKGISANEVAEAVRSVHSGVSLISPSMASKLVSEFVNVSKRAEALSATGSPLSDREVEVLQHIAQGLSNKEIADRLTLSENTIKKHVRNILDKVHMRTRVEAALFAVRTGIIDDPGSEPGAAPT